MSTLRIHKFGGASVKSADALSNVLQIIERLKEEKQLVLVSAMGKTTNALEQLLDAWIAEDAFIIFRSICYIHFSIISAGC